MKIILKFVRNKKKKIAYIHGPHNSVYLIFKVLLTNVFSLKYTNHNINIFSFIETVIFGTLFLFIN